ncbi:MAG: YceI family protein, partial [Bacteroidota bacterium]
KLLKHTKSILFLFLSVIGIGVHSQEIDLSNQYQINKDFSYLNFSTSIAGFPVIRGAVKSYQATMYYDPENVTNSSATIRITSESFSTAHDQRDEALQGEYFLESEKFPAIWFQGSDVTVTETGLNISGNINIKEIVKPATVQIEKPTIMKKAMNNLDLMVVKGTLNLNRKDFELGTAGPFAANPMFGEEITIEFTFIGFSYTIDYLKASYVGTIEGRENPVGLVYNEVKENGVKKGLKLMEFLSKQKEYKQDNWLSHLANIGWILMVDGYGKESLPFYEKALSYNPKHLVSLLRLGDAYTIAGEYDKALEHFQNERSLPERARFTHIPQMIMALGGEFELKDMK